MGQAGELERAAYAERLALMMTSTGMPRMASRVLATMLVSEDGIATSAELGAKLQVGAPAISGAMKFLAEIGMVIKEREPGRRRDHYRLGDDPWYRSTVTQNQSLQLWENAASEGVELMGTDTAAGQRLDETRRFFEFLRTEMPLLIERWQQHR